MEATIVPWYSSRPNVVCSFKKVVFARPAKSGCVGAVPLSTIVIATPGPGAAEGVEVVAVSTLVDTEPVGYLDQPRFLNGVAALETERSPRELLDLLMTVEAHFGRDRAAVPAQGPRTLDLDLLLYENAEIDE